jgi:hypothetical protein
MNFLDRLSRSLSAFAAIAGSVFVLSSARPAAASPTYPGVVQKVYGGDCAPQCTLCHNRPEGGPEHYNPSGLDPSYVAKMAPNTGEGTFFANFINVVLGIKRQPLPMTDEALENALKLYATTPCNAASTAPCDSDGDGVIDAKEFAETPSGDPNVAHGNLCIGPTYGCGATITRLPRDPSAASHAAEVLALLCVGLVFVRRRRR